MVNAILAYDISALMILFVGGTYFIRTSPDGTSRYNMFVHILTAAFVAGIADIARVMLVRTAGMNSIIWRLFNAAFLASILIVSIAYLIYIIDSTDTWHIVGRKMIQMVISVIPAILSSFVLLLGIFFPIIFGNTDGVEIYYRWGYYLLNISLIIYMLICANYIRFLKTYINKRYSVELLSPLVVVLISLLIQLIFPNHHVIVFAIAVDCMLLILVNHRAEESLDVTTGMHTYWMFARDMKMKMSTGKEMELILVNIINYEHALRLAGYDEMLEMMKPISSEIMRIMKRKRARYTCYYNGDGKFAIELGKTHDSDISKIAAEIVKSINDNMNLAVSDFDIRINTCVVSCPQDINDVNTLFMLVADLDLVTDGEKVLSAKEITGTKEFEIKKDMATIIDNALANKHFSVFYQPIYNVNKKRFTSAEALIRLNDPKYGYISPGLFIPISERSGAIHKIGSFVIDEVCKFIASDDFKSLGVDYIEINLSVMQCLRVDLADEIIERAQFYEIDPKCLNLEITETASVYSQDRLQSNIHELSKAGFTFSLDDFGTGYSNLMRIALLPLSIVKLDRTFVLLEEKEGFHVIIKNIIQMIKDMGKDVLVEGIETEEMMTTFSDMGVDEIQGFYFSKPLTRSDYIRFMKKHR